jgi:hypothetical protein
LERLREQYVEQTRANAEHMTAEELRWALAEAQAQHYEQQATVRLTDAKLILNQLVEEYPQSGAANIARQMLECGELKLREQVPDSKEPYDDFGEPASVPTRRPTF